MARTEKDRPYNVRAKEASKGVIKHHRYCNGLPYRWTNYTKVTNHIFHAHEVKEMEALKEILAEDGSEFTVTETSGYLISTNPNTYNDFLYKRPLKPFVRDRVETILNGSYRDEKVGRFDIFYIFEVTKVIENKNNKDDACCGATLPKAIDRAECPCCKRYVRKESTKTAVRSELAAIRKEFYAGIDSE